MFKKLTADAILPKRQTRFSAGFDVFANEDVVICAGETKLIGLGIAIDKNLLEKLIPKKVYPLPSIEADIYWSSVCHNFFESHYLELHIRSSLRAKGLTSLGTGVIDIDYPDEIKMVVHNPVTLEGYSIDDGYRLCVPTSCDYSYKINKGDKIGQLILLSHAGYLMPSDYTLDNERVGGFDSSGVR